MSAAEKIRTGEGPPCGGDLLASLRAISESVIRFDFVGMPVAAIRLEEWVATQDGLAMQHLRSHVAGRIVADGSVFVLFSDDCGSDRLADRSIVQRLTQRELKVACMIGDGLTNKEIARKLGISAHTVREHCRRACAKLNISKRSALVRCLYDTAKPAGWRR